MLRRFSALFRAVPASSAVVLNSRLVGRRHSSTWPLNGKVALVTGGSRGLGAGIAVELGKAGATVYLTDAPPNIANPELIAGSTDLQQVAEKCIALFADPSKPHELEHLFELIENTEETLSFVVNNPYLHIPAHHHSSEDPPKKFFEREDFADRSAIPLNAATVLRHAYVIAYYSARLMIKQQSGFIVNISPVGLFADDLFHLNGFGESAVNKMTADMSNELEGTNVSCFALVVGDIASESGPNKGAFDADKTFLPGRVIGHLAQDEVLPELFHGSTLTTGEMMEELGLHEAVVDVPEAAALVPLDEVAPERIEFADVASAAFAIRGGVVLTPTVKSHQLSAMLGVQLFNKMEFLQATGSFKERGARYALHRLSEEERRAGVIAASAGNHALALAYHGQQLGVPVTVVMPGFAPLMKISSCRAYGAEVILKGRNIQEARVFAMELAGQRALKYVNGFDYPDVIAGQGTIGLELLEQVKNIDAVIVPAGGGGLIAGVALAVKTLKPEILVIGVESESCASFSNALHGTQHELHAESSLADGLAVPTVGTNAVHIARGLVDELVTVCEESIALAILRLLEMEKSVVEGAGAVGLAALLSGKLPQLRGKRVVNILTGGNIDSTVLGRTIERGLAADGRLVKFDVVVSDRPGGIAELATRIAETGASIKDIFHERAWLAANVFEVRVRVVVETRDRAHVEQLRTALSKKYANVRFYERRPKFLQVE